MRLDHLLSKGRQSREMCFTVELPKRWLTHEEEVPKQSFGTTFALSSKGPHEVLKVSGVDALGGHTRSHPEHDG